VGGAGGDVQLVVEDEGEDDAGADEVVEAEGVDRRGLGRPASQRRRLSDCEGEPERCLRPQPGRRRGKARYTRANVPVLELHEVDDVAGRANEEKLQTASWWVSVPGCAPCFERGKRTFMLVL